MAVREQTVRELSDLVAERWRLMPVYDRRRKPFKTVIRDAIRGRGITDRQDAGELLKRIAEECAKRSASHRKAVAALKESA